MKFITSLVILATLLISGCSFEVIAPATKGKILGTAGYQKGVLAPGKYTLYGRDEMVRLDTGVQTRKETIKVLMDDKLTLMVDVRFRGRISDNETVVDAMFNDISAVNNWVTFDQVYGVYGAMAVRNVTREIISKYNTEDVNKNYARLSDEVGKALLVALQNTPVQLSDVALGDIAYPAVITTAVEDAKSRDLAIKKEEAQARIDLVKKKNEQALAKADYDIEITRAKAVRDSNKILGQNLTDKLLELKRLEVQKELAKSGGAVFIPYQAMQSVGVQNRMYRQK